METTINRFEKQLEKWNRGVLRGAQARLAKSLQVSTATVALWATGKRHPSKGYLAHMARLFKLDISQVARLFYQPSVAIKTCPLSLENHPSTLHDSAADWYGPISLTKTVSLPVFTRVPDFYPRYNPTEVKGWWTLPQSEAKQAQFLFSFPTKNNPDRLLFIQPCSTWKNDRWMLCKKTDAYLLVYVQCLQKQVLLQTTEGEKLTSKNIRPVGLVVRHITDVIF